MGNLIDRGLVPRDDPMFSGGPEIFSRPESNAPTKNSAKSMDGATQGKLKSAEKAKNNPTVISEEDEERLSNTAIANRHKRFNQKI